MVDGVDRAFDRGNYAEAVGLLRAHHASSPPDLVTMSNLEQAERYEFIVELRRTVEQWPESDEAVAALVKALYGAGRVREANDVVEGVWSKVSSVEPTRRNSLSLLVAVRLGLRDRSLDIVRAWPRPQGGTHQTLAVLAHMCAEAMARRSPAALAVFVDVLACLEQTWGLSGDLAGFLGGYSLAARSWLAVAKTSKEFAVGDDKSVVDK